MCQLFIYLCCCLPSFLSGQPERPTAYKWTFAYMIISFFDTVVFYIIDVLVMKFPFWREGGGESLKP